MVRVKWFLAVNVLARFHRRDRDNRMPVVGRGHDDGVDVIALQQMAEIVEELGPPVLLLISHTGGASKMILVDIADGRNLDPGVAEEFLQMVIAAADADADQAQDHAVARGGFGRRGRASPGGGGGCGGSRQRAAGGILEKAAASDAGLIAHEAFLLQ